jgi:hypothetical protein
LPHGDAETEDDREQQHRRNDTGRASTDPTITTTRMIEENDVVVAEGRVRARRKDGGVLNAVTYLVEVK